VKAVLLLQDGTVFEGKSFGAKATKCGEVVFNTSMTGYQEILTDPSYHEQIVTMTYPLIGNYGTNKDDVESRKIFAHGFVVKENCPYPSNWRNQLSLSDYLKQNQIVGLEDIDTRKLVRHIRKQGAMKAVISSELFGIKKLREKLNQYPGLVGRDIVKKVSSTKPYLWDKPVYGPSDPRKIPPERSFKVIALDFGIKYNILRLLCSFGCHVQVVPARTPVEKIMSYKPDGVFLSNGPGDPAPVSYAIETTRKLLAKVPVFGICLGHQLLCLALGGKTYKLKFGHRGANHPVKDLKTGHIAITSQNHGFCVALQSLENKDVEITHLNLNDNTLEGIYSRKYPAFSVQYHPEASPGPHDSHYLFDEFIRLMQNNRK